MELFARIVAGQRRFGAKKVRLPGSLGGRHTHPPELARRLDGITHERTRLGIEQILKGTLPEKARFREDAAFVVRKFGTVRNLYADFWAAVRLSGGTYFDVIRHPNGFRQFTAKDGTVFMMRQYSRDGRPTNEFHITPPGGDLTKIKIRYEMRYP